MISPDLYIAFIAATSILMIIPGPNVALIVANSVAHGTRYGLLTVGATSSAVVVHLALTVIGAAAMLDFLAASFDWLRWLGVSYLVWLGMVIWRAPVADRVRGENAVGARCERSSCRRSVVALRRPLGAAFARHWAPEWFATNEEPRRFRRGFLQAGLRLVTCGLG